MAAIWTPESRFRIWLEIEAHACDAQADLGVIPRERRGPSASGELPESSIDEIERETKHDVIAFLTNLAEHAGPKLRAPGHDVLDVLDTCFAVQLSPRRRSFSPTSMRSRRPEAPRLRAQADAVHRPQPWRARGTDHLRTEARRLLRRVAAQPRAAGARGGRSPPAPSPGRSAPSPRSTRRSSGMSRKRWGSLPSSPSRHR